MFIDTLMEKMQSVVLVKNEFASTQKRTLFAIFDKFGQQRFWALSLIGNIILEKLFGIWETLIKTWIEKFQSVAFWGKLQLNI